MSASPIGAKAALVWSESPDNMERTVVQPDRRARFMYGTLGERRAAYKEFAVNYIVDALKQYTKDSQSSEPEIPLCSGKRKFFRALSVS